MFFLCSRGKQYHFTFVRLYSTGDFIGVEIGYHIFVAVFRVTGQHIYFERHCRQQTDLLEISAFMMLEEWRRNRQVSTYYWSSWQTYDNNRQGFRAGELILKSISKNEIMSITCKASNTYWPSKSVQTMYCHAKCIRNTN